MDTRKVAMRLGAGILAAALVLGAARGGAFDWIGRLPPEALSLLIYLQTGRVVRLPSIIPTQPIQPPSDTQPTQAPVILPVFSQQDLLSVIMRYGCESRPDLAPLLTSPLTWDLRDGQPAVLIIHTHATESYTKQPGEDYTESSAYRTLDESYNMVSIGDHLAALLEAGGIRVIHDRQLHDYPSYNGAYDNARAAIEDYLAQYPTIRLVLDLHRDAAGDGNGGQVSTSATVDGEEASQLMLVLGTDEGSTPHPNWQENLSLGLKLAAMLEQQNPGVCRGINLRRHRFNMDLSPGGLLIEVGTAGDTHQKALHAAAALAEGILALSAGAG